MDGFILWGDYLESAWVSHTCGASESVDTLAVAVAWAHDHSCEPHPVAITSTKEEA